MHRTAAGRAADAAAGLAAGAGLQGVDCGHCGVHHEDGGNTQGQPKNSDTTPSLELNCWVVSGPQINFW